MKIRKKISAMINQNKNRIRWRRLLTGTGCLLVFLVTYLLVLPAITLDREAAGTMPGMQMTSNPSETASEPEEKASGSNDRQGIIFGFSGSASTTTGDSASDGTDSVKTSLTNPNQNEENKAAPMPYRLTATDGTSYTITVAYDDQAGIPGDAVLEASEILPGSQEYASYAQVAENLDYTVGRIFHIFIMSGGVKIQPASPVQVSISYEEAETIGEDMGLSVFHFSDSPATAQKKETATSSLKEVLPSEDNREKGSYDELTFETASFSAFATASRQKANAYETLNPLIYLPFDGSSSLVENQGSATASITVNGTPAWEENGCVGGALSLNGSSYLDLDYGCIQGLDELTVTYYTKPNRSEKNQWSFFAGTSTDNYLGVFQRINGTDTDKRGRVVVDRKLNGANTQTATDRTSMMDTEHDDWIHVAVVYKTAETIIYLNGAETKRLQHAANAPSPAQILAAGGHAYLGHSDWGDAENYSGLIDEYCVFGSALTEAQIAGFFRPKYVLSPLNANGNKDIHTLASNRTIYQYMHLFDQEGIADRVNRISLVPEYDAQGKARITLPDHEGLAEGNQTQTGGYYLSQEGSPYPMHLAGWYNIGTGQYYDVSKGPVAIEISETDNNVFYADWWPESYPTVMPGDHYEDTPQDTGSDELYTPDTSGYVTTKVFDYNELFNVAGTNLIQKGTYREIWRDNYSGILFFDNSEFNVNGKAKDDEGTNWRVWGGGAIGDPGQRRDHQNAWYPNGAGSKGLYEQYQTTIDSLFDSQTDAMGIHYLGEGNHLYVYNPDTGYYQYDSSKWGAVYNKEEQRFYVAKTPTLHYPNNANDHQWTDKPWDQADGFLPFNNWTDDPAKYPIMQDGSTNYWFGLSSEIEFWLPNDVGTGGNKIENEDMVFDFSGDDDVWVFVDGQLVLDLGGVHNELHGNINFSTGTVTTGPISTGTVIEEPNDFLRSLHGGVHHLKILYMERGGNASNCKITFNIVPSWKQDAQEVNTVTVQKKWNDKTGEDYLKEIETNVVMKLWKLDKETGNRVEDNPCGSITLPLKDKDGKNVWTYTWERLDPAYDYEVEEALSEDGRPYQAKYDSTIGQSYDYWTLARTDETTENGQTVRTLGDSITEVLIGSRNNIPGYQPESGKDDWLLGVNDSGQVVSIPADVDTYGYLDPAYANSKTKWTIETTGQVHATGELEYYYLKIALGADGSDIRYLRLDNDTDQMHLVSDKSQAGRFYFDQHGDLHGSRGEHVRLAVDQNGIHVSTSANPGVSQDPPEVGDKVFVYAYQKMPSKVFQYKISNTAAYKVLNLKKISSIKDGHGQEILLADAEFDLYRWEGDANTTPSIEQLTEDMRVCQLKSDSDGIIRITDPDNPLIFAGDNSWMTLERGVYYLSETKAPEGYFKNGLMKIHVSDNGVKIDGTQTSVTSETISLEGQEGKYQFDVYHGAVTNKPGFELPSTGGSGRGMIIAAGMLLALLAAAGLLLRKQQIQ